jgi:hypothetical protein
MLLLYQRRRSLRKQVNESRKLSQAGFVVWIIMGMRDY